MHSQHLWLLERAAYIVIMRMIGRDRSETGSDLLLVVVNDD